MEKQEERKGITGTFRILSSPEKSGNGNIFPFNPQDPFGSLLASPNPFAILWDTDHGDPSIVQAVVDNLQDMARSGVKHLMLEYPPEEKSSALLKGFYASPQTVTPVDLIKNSDLFESVHARTPEEGLKMGLAYVRLIIEAERHGIQVHMAGDEAGYALSDQQAQILQDQDDYIKDNQAIHRIYEYTLKDQALLNSLQPNNRERLMNEILAHGERLLDFGRRWDELEHQRIQERMGVEAEISRASRFLDLAQGEKAVVLWGQAHHGKLDVALNHKLRQNALKEGIPFEETRSMDLLASRDSVNQMKSIGVELSAPVRYFAQEKQFENMMIPEAGASILSPSSKPSPGGGPGLSF